MRFLDLSITLDPDSPFEKTPPAIKRATHDGEGLQRMRRNFGVEPNDLTLSDGLGWAAEEVTLGSHVGTHVDAPWHYGPVSEGKRSRTIDDVPLEWCFGDGVVLDFTHKRGGDVISAAEVQEALARAGHTLKPLDIVLVRTGCAEQSSAAEYFDQPGLGRESVLWLVERGVKVIGIDAWGLDTKFEAMAERFRQTGDSSQIWQAHFAGLTREYLQIERLCNLDQLPSTGFQVSCFPVKIKGGSAGWSRVVAMLAD